MSALPIARAIAPDARARRWLSGAEAASVFAGIMLYIWWLQPRAKGSWLALLLLAAGSHAARGEHPAALGFRGHNFAACARAVAPALLAAAALLLAVGVAAGSVKELPPPRAIAFVLYYCIWGLVQQYALNGYFLNRIAAAWEEPDAPAVPLLAAALFAAAHVPNLYLMAVTLVAGYICARVYLAYRNLYVLGIAHGLLGSVLYYVTPLAISHRFYVGPHALHWQ
ncbi:MAG TPA: CPBP family glutamic-type intramembrane protease [Gemmatimonadaceae bacterium]|nr:CPBP family glutamic-type intramembrane protease [Gemmatimonadaceae bacterium]